MLESQLAFIYILRCMRKMDLTAVNTLVGAESARAIYGMNLTEQIIVILIQTQRFTLIRNPVLT
jgi:hypothetical protein